MRSQTAIFGQLVRSFMRAAPVAVPPATPCAEAVRLMTAERRTCVVVVDGSDRPIGILTEQDVTRRVAFAVGGETAIEEVMSAPVLTIAADEYLYFAIGRMRRRGLRHMPVVDGDGRLAGILDLHDALAVAGSRLMDRIDSLTREDTVEGLKAIKQAQVDVAEGLLADNLPAPEVQALLTRVNNDIYRRVVDRNLAAMADDGWGEPPVAFAVIVMGSGGRGENYLFPDQDNGFVIADYPDDAHTRIDGFFIELAERMTRDLDAVGLPYCNGYCMAVNPLWRKTLSQWRAQITLWGRKRHFVAIRLADIFFDFQPVYGDPDLSAALRNTVTEMVRKNHPFLQQMYAEEADHDVALGFFGGFITEREKEDYKGQVNLKYAGTIPLVEAVRLLALREGIAETSTLGRIDALHESGFLDANEREDLSGAFRLMSDILLRRQIDDFKADNRVTYFIDPEALPRRRRRLLHDGLKAIDGLRKKVRSEFTGQIF